MKAMVLSVMVFALLAASAASAGTAPNLGRMPAVQASLLKIETRLAPAGVHVVCNVAPSTVPIAQCFAMRPGAQHPVVGVAAHVVCSGACGVRPVCTYLVSVVRGFPVVIGFSRVVNVCRVGWEKTVK